MFFKFLTKYYHFISYLIFQKSQQNFGILGPRKRIHSFLIHICSLLHNYSFSISYLSYILRELKRKRKLSILPFNNKYQHDNNKLLHKIFRIDIFIQKSAYNWHSNIIMNLNTFFGFLALIVVLGQAATYRKVVLPDPRAVCLDGSRGVYYISDSGRNPKKFIIHFQGGGWCGGYDMQGAIQSCYDRSNTPFGSSSTYSATMTINAGIMSDSLKNNFADYTKIYIKYCDGSGHQGSRQNPVNYKGKNLYFRGQDLTIATLNHLQQTHGFFTKSQQIMVTGSSAGGVAAFLWVNYVWEKASIKNVYAVPDAGIFLDYINYKTGRSQLKAIFTNLFKLSNVDVNPPIPQCAKAHPGQTYLCMFAENIFPHLKTIVFPIQSLYDTVSIPVIVGADCVKGRSLEGCTTQQRTHIEQYHKAVSNFLVKITENPYNGCWGLICAEHMLTYDQKFYSPNWTVPMKSSNTMDKTLSDWVLKKSTGGYRHIDSGVWPNNQPCST